jgi:RNAse (barnase) inhibitor barstar
VTSVTGVYVIDGAKVTTLETLWDIIGSAVNGPRGYFGSGLDSFNDCLRGGFGTPDDDDFVFEWRNHENSSRNLGYAETVRQLEIRLQRCHPANRSAVAAELRAVQTGTGPTVFDWLVDILTEHDKPRLA